MSRTIEVIDPDGERKSKIQRKILLLACVISLGLFSYPQIKDYSSRWSTLRGGRKLALYLSMLKTRAILTKTPLEARFQEPDLVEVHEVSSCGPNARRTKLWEIRLGEFAEGVKFASRSWVSEQVDTKEPFLSRFCYDPLYGSSIFADGLVHGAIFLAVSQDLAEKRGERALLLIVEGPSAEISLD
ncbi:MAG: hypothetical protein AB1540_07840 [Bdellovibrionota bacterium]